MAARLFYKLPWVISLAQVQSWRNMAGRICSMTEGHSRVPLFRPRLTMLSKMNCRRYISAGQRNATVGKVYSA